MRRFNLKKKIIIDRKLNIAWERFPSTNNMNLKEAKEYANSLKLKKLKWRLPTIKELESLVDRNFYSPAIVEELRNIDSEKWLFWHLSSSSINNNNKVWVVNLSYGGIVIYDESDNLRVRCVADI